MIAADPADRRLVLASHNAGKLREIRAFLAPYGLEVVSAGELGLPEPEETGDTFEANAELKARAACEAASLPALADDSGFCVDALGGDPGVLSARWAGPGKDFSMAMRTVEEKLQAMGAATPERRRARFVAVLCLARPGGSVSLFRGEIAGHCVWPPRGVNGFGYDPMFVPEDDDRTFGEMPAEEKHRRSHRARAFAKFEAALLKTP